MAPALYRRLPGRGRSIGFSISPGRYTLWIAPDHLLSLEARVGSEIYRRFYFRDIEAFIVRRTPRRQLWNWVLISIALFAGAPSALVWQRNPDQVAWLIATLSILGFWLFLALVNTIRGPTCNAHIRTAVQIESLPSLGRLRTFEKVLTQIKPLIEQAQGSIQAEYLAAAETGSFSSSAQTVHEPSIGTGAPQSIRHEPGYIHMALFCVLLLMGALSFWDVQAASQVSTSLHLLTSLVGTLLLILALRRQGSSDLPPAVKHITWAVLAYYILGVFAGAALGFMFAIRHPGQPPPSDPLFIRAEAGYTEIMMSSGVIAVVLAILGIVFLLLQRGGATRLSSR